MSRKDPGSVSRPVSGHLLAMWLALRRVLDRELPLLHAHDVPRLVCIIHLPHHREARLLYYASALRALEGRVSHDATHLGSHTGPAHERLDRGGRVPAVPLRLDDGVAD